MQTTIERVDWNQDRTWIAYLANGDSIAESYHSSLRVPFPGQELTVRMRADRPMMRAYERSDGITYFGRIGPKLPAFALNR